MLPTVFFGQWFPPCSPGLFYKFPVENTRCLRSSKRRMRVWSSGGLTTSTPEATWGSVDSGVSERIPGGRWNWRNASLLHLEILLLQFLPAKNLEGLPFCSYFCFSWGSPALYIHSEIRRQRKLLDNIFSDKFGHFDSYPLIDLFSIPHLILMNNRQVSKKAQNCLIDK